MTDEIMKVINDNVYGVWFLIGAALVFWMQAGFAMVEAGFTRAKNSGNIIMKNLMDFCIGTVISVIRDLYLTQYSVQQQQPSYQVRWQKEQNS